MKKIFGISLAAVLIVSPMMAGAVPVEGDPGGRQTGLTTEQATAITASATPKYALKGATAADGYAATAGYVKGAYNALIKGINKTQDEIDTLNTGISTYANSVNHLLDNTATQDGTVATIKNATSTEQISGSSVNISGVTTSSISATASGDVNLSVSVMDDWDNDGEATNPVQATTSFSGLTVNGLAMSAPGTNNTATLTKTGIGGTVNVAEYLTGVYDYTPLINTEGNSYGYKSADGSSANAAGLSNDEWKLTWNAYGTVKGISKCSVTGEDMGSADRGKTGNLSDTAGGGCWCKMTGFTEKNGTKHNDNSLWVFSGSTYGSVYNCRPHCAYACGYIVYASSAMRSGVFGSVQQ